MRAAVCLITTLAAAAAFVAAPPGRAVERGDGPVLTRAPLPAEDFAPLAQRVERALARAAERRRVAGLGLALLVDGDVRWIGTAGSADRGSGRRLTIDTPLPVGELSRLYLAALALALADAGRLDLDAPIAALLPELTVRSRFPAAPPITARHLLSHHAGLPYARLRGAYQPADAPLEPLDWREVAYLAQPTGSVQLVSNLGYELLGQVLEAAAGAPLDDQLAARLGAPLGLVRTGWARPADLARGHRKGKAEPALVARERAALGVIASTAELARFAAALMPEAAASPLGAAARAELVRVQNAAVPFDVGNGAGLGFNLARSVRPGVGRIAFLVGAFPGFRTELRLALDHGLGVLAVANSEEAGEVLFELSADALDALLEARDGIAPRQRDRPLPAEIPWPAGARPDTSLAPRYSTPFGLVEIRPRDGDFHFDAVGLGFRATPRADAWYGVRYDLLGVIPVGFSRLNRVAIAPAELGGERVLLAFTNDRHFLIGTATAPDPAMADYARHAGRYRLANPDALADRLALRDARLTYDEGLLALEYEIPAVIDLAPRLPLLPIRRNVFVVPGRGANLGDEIVLDLDGATPALIYSGYRLERIGD